MDFLDLLKNILFGAVGSSGSNGTAYSTGTLIGQKPNGQKPYESGSKKYSNPLYVLESGGKYNKNELGNADMFTAFGNSVTGNLDYQRQLEQLLMEQQFNHNEAQLNRDFNLYLSNTAYQRQAQDLSAAGFNPALMLGTGGASSPTAAAAHSNAHTSHAPNSQLVNTLVNGLLGVTNSALRRDMIEEQTERFKALQNVNRNQKKQGPIPDWFKENKQVNSNQKISPDLMKIAEELFS